MKKLYKLQINSEKIIINDELITLRGGYSGPCTTVCYGGDPKGSICYGYLLCVSGNCDPECKEAFSDSRAYGIPSTC
jgi:hypothetical protein